MSKYEAVYFMGDNQAINRVRVDSSKTSNRGAFSGSLAALDFSRDGSVGPVSRYREHFTEIP